MKRATVMLVVFVLLVATMGAILAQDDVQVSDNGTVSDLCAILDGWQGKSGMKYLFEGTNLYHDEVVSATITDPANAALRSIRISDRGGKYIFKAGESAAPSFTLQNLLDPASFVDFVLLGEGDGFFYELSCGRQQPKVTLCHKPGTNAQVTITVGEPALSAHLDHGDTVGACPETIGKESKLCATLDGFVGESGEIYTFKNKDLYQQEVVTATIQGKLGEMRLITIRGTDSGLNYKLGESRELSFKLENVGDPSNVTEFTLLSKGGSSPFTYQLSCQLPQKSDLCAQLDGFTGYNDEKYFFYKTNLRHDEVVTATDLCTFSGACIKSYRKLFIADADKLVIYKQGDSSSTGFVLNPASDPQLNQDFLVSGTGFSGGTLVEDYILSCTLPE